MTIATPRQALASMHSALSCLLGLLVLLFSNLGGDGIRPVRDFNGADEAIHQAAPAAVVPDCIGPPPGEPAPDALSADAGQGSPLAAAAGSPRRNPSRLPLAVYRPVPPARAPPQAA